MDWGHWAFCTNRVEIFLKLKFCWNSHFSEMRKGFYLTPFLIPLFSLPRVSHHVSHLCHFITSACNALSSHIWSSAFWCYLGHVWEWGCCSVGDWQFFHLTVTLNIRSRLKVKTRQKYNCLIRSHQISRNYVRSLRTFGRSIIARPCLSVELKMSLW